MEILQKLKELPHGPTMSFPCVKPKQMELVQRRATYNHIYGSTIYNI